MSAPAALFPVPGPGTGKLPVPRKSKVLSVVHQARQNGYYCGPASGAIIASYHKIKKSKYDGSALLQDAMANKNHMKTAANKVTDWSSKLFVTGLNRWTGWTGSVAMAQSNAPSTALTAWAFQWRIGVLGSPVAADTVEFVNRDHYNGHPRDKLIGHWIVGYGYSSSGATLYWTDPAAPNIFTKANKYFTQSNTSFNQYLQSNGIAW